MFCSTREMYRNHYVCSAEVVFSITLDSNVEIFLVILKHSLLNYYKCFLVTDSSYVDHGEMTVRAKFVIKIPRFKGVNFNILFIFHFSLIYTAGYGYLYEIFCSNFLKILSPISADS